MTSIPPLFPPYRAPSNVLYVPKGYFDGNWTTGDQLQIQQTIQNTVTDLSATEFNVFVNFVMGISIDSDNNVTFDLNGTPMADLYPSLASEFQQLASSNSALILMSIGGWDGSNNFAAMLQYQNNVGNFAQLLFDQVIQPLGINGVDFDLEAGCDVSWQAVYQDYGSLVATVTNDLAALGCVVTHVPPSGIANLYYINGDSDVPSIVQACQTATGNNIAWLNIQFYSGGDQGDESATESYYNTGLLAPLAALNLTGVNPNTFLVAGFTANTSTGNGNDPQGLTFATTVVSSLTATNGTIGGCMTWTYSLIPSGDASSWSTAINAALGLP